MAAKKPKKNRAAAARAIASSVILSPASVRVPSAPAISTRAPFIAGGPDVLLEEVCRSSGRPAACMKGQTKVTRRELGLQAFDPESAYAAKCKRVGGKMTKAYVKPIRPGKVELDFLSPAQAKRLKTLPGPNLRLCLRDDAPGYLVPVSDPAHAQKLAQDFAACTKGDKNRMPACAKKFATAAWKGSTPPLGKVVVVRRGLAAALFGGR